MSICARFLLLSAAIYAEADVSAGVRLIGVFVLSRALSALALVKMKSARQNGMLNDISKVAEKRMVTFSGCVYAFLCLILWAVSGGWIAPICALASALCYLYYQHMSYKQFGGVTGDLAAVGLIRAKQNWRRRKTPGYCFIGIFMKPSGKLS